MALLGLVVSLQVKDWWEHYWWEQMLEIMRDLREQLGEPVREGGHWEQCEHMRDSQLNVYGLKVQVLP